MPFAEPGVEAHYGPSRTVAIQDLSLTLRLFPTERRFEGEATIQVQALPTHEGVVEFDLAEVEVLEVTDGNGDALEWHTHDEALRVHVANPERIVVRWKGSDPKAGLYFTGPTPWKPERQHMAWTQCQDEDGHFLFPCFDHPSTKHPWTIELEGPAGYTLLSNGELQAQGERGDRVWARYRQAAPMPAYLVTAVCAQLTVVEATWRDKAVRYLVPVGEEEAVSRAMGKTPIMLEVFSERTGVAYPWPRYDQVVVHDFIFGGMENIACTTMTQALLVDEKGVLDWDPDGLVSHELAHQWFGDLVTCQDWSQAWLNESWATFMEAVWWEHDRETAEATWYRWQTAAGYFDEDGGRYRRPIVSYDFREPIDVFDRHLYEKGGCVLMTLRNEIGEDAFWAGVQKYLTRHSGQTVHTRHFQRALEEASGTNLDRFFDQWVHGAGHPALTIKLGQEPTRKDAPGLFTVSVKQTQEHDKTAKAFHFSLRLELVFKDGSTKSMVLPIRERERTWAVPVDGELSTVRVDPEFHVLADVTLQAPHEWLVAGLGDACPVVAVRSAAALLEEGGAKAMGAVFTALRSHPFYGVRADVARRLAERKGPDALDALLDALAVETDPRAKRVIVTALGKFRNTRAADALVTVLEGELPTWQLQGAALVALGATRDPRARETITPHLDVDSWSDLVRQRALSGLASTEDPGVLELLVAHTRDDRSDRVRAAAAGGLGKLGDKVESVRPKVVERLIEMLTEPGFRTQLSVISALGSLRDPKASGPLSRVHRSAPDGRIRREAYEALVSIRKGRTTEAALSSLRTRVDKLSEENAQLRARLDRLESKLDK